MSTTPPLPRHGYADPAPPEAGVPERDFDVRYYTDLLWHRRILLAATAIGGLALGILAGELQTPRYQARTSLQVRPPNPTSLAVTDALVQTGNPIRDRQFFNTQLNVLRSRSIAERVVERLKLEDRADFKEYGDATAFFLTHLSIQPVPDTYVVEVRLTSHNPQDAALWANTLTDIYMDYSIEGRVQAAERAYQWVTERLAVTQNEMEEAQDKLLKSYQGQDLYVPEGSVSAITTSITTLNEDHIRAQARRIELEAELGEFRSMRNRGRSPDTIPQVGEDETVSQINGRIQSLTLELTQLREKYKAGHPEVQKVQAQLEQLENDKEARVSQIEESLRAEYRQLRRREAELKAAIEGHKTRAAEQSRKLTELESLKKQADAAGGLYGVLLQKLNETNIAASIQDDNVRLLDRAVVPTSPVWPRKRQLALVSLLAGLLLGAGWVLLRDALDNKIKDADDVERRLHLEVLAAIPKYAREDDELAKEAYQNLRTALLFSRRKDRGHVVLVTGAAPGEGKTTTLLQLGRRLADAQERTVVVDCDLRKANLHTRLNVSREPGFTDYFLRPVELMTLVRSTRFANLSIIPAGALPPNPPALIAREEFETALEQLRQSFQWILIDSPPVAAVTDALLLARQADSTVLVVQQNRVDRAVVKRAVASLRKVTPRVVGAVLNAVDIKSKGYYGYGYGYGYAYGKSKSSAPRGRRMVGHRSRKARVTPTAEVSDASPS
ncbi:MAG: polysaccharide biosynthesis tyrosine autokinase [Acidobacteria bacterium]|nr:polysaccharide biosynthesis tyrosine autokinase [Acidobacteriota bacterium]